MLVDRYQIIRPIGASLLLVQDQDGTPRVLKRLPEALMGDAAAQHRFRLEAWRASRLAGPGLASAEAGLAMEGDRPTYAMAYIEGPPATLVPPADLAPLVRQVATALARLHALGWVHAGLEPAAIRRGEHGAVLVGYGHLTPICQPAVRPGSADFQPPEQRAGRPLDARSDLYALGGLIHYWLTGTYPTEGLALPPEHPLSALAARLLEPDPARRPASAEAVLTELGVDTPLPTPRLEPPQVPRPKLLRPLETALSALEEGAGQAWRLEGPAGSGKSALLAQMAAVAKNAGVPVLRARGAGAASAPLTPWRQILPELLALARERDHQAAERLAARLEAPPAPAHPGADPAPGLLAHRLAWAELIEAIAAPGLVILLDDWEWADEASRALAAFLAGRADRQPLLLVAAGQAVALEAPPWSLPPRGREESFALIEGLLDAPASKSDMEAIHAVATGLPGFVRDLASRLLAIGSIRREGDTWVVDSLEDWPTTEGALAWQRASELPEAAWAVGASIAMLAPIASPAPLEVLVDEGLEPGLDALLQARVIVQGPEGYRFSHPAFQAIFLEHGSPEARLDRHARLAKGAPGPDNRVFLAAHAAGAARPDLLTVLALDAATTLLAHGASQTARTLLEEGLAALEADHAARAAYMHALGDASRLEGALEEASARDEAALAEREAWSDKLPSAMALAETLLRLGRAEAARDRYREAVVLAQSLEETDLLVWALSGLTEAQAALGDRPSALTSGEAAVGAASLASPVAKAQAMAAFGGLLAAGGRERQAEGRALLQQATGLFEAEGDQARLLDALLALGSAELAAGEPRLAAATSARALAIALTLGLEAAASEASLVAASAARALGDQARALELAIAARAHAETAERPLLVAEAQATEGLARLDLGAADQAVAATGAAVGRLGKRPPAAIAARLRLAHAEALLAASQLPEAVEALLSARGPVEAAQRAELVGLRALLLGQWALRTGDRDRARQELKAALAAPSQHLTARAALELGRLALTAAAPTEAAGWLEQARRAASALGAEKLLAEVETAEAALSERQGPAAGTPAAAAARIEALLQEASGLLPRALAGAHEAQAMAARVKALEAAHGLWKRLMTAQGPEAASALAEAALSATAASHAVVLGKQMEPLAVRGRAGELPFSPQLIDDGLCREAIKRKAPAVAEPYVAVPL
ncbi:MAG: AAA family ATPase, partial [Candidatus Sericytochromatia bacterium]